MEETRSRYDIAADFILNSGRSLVITGKAGSGKTTFLKDVIGKSTKNIAIAAPTGIAAINAGGVTVHSLFQLPLTTLVPTPETKKLLLSQKLREDRIRLMQSLDLLVIDEISMLRADTLDAIDTILRHQRKRSDVPFGGVQLIMTGDMSQLSPVVRREEKELMDRYYDGPFFFHSKVMRELKPVYIEFDKIYRQSDAAFIEILNEIRDNRLTDKSIAILNKQVVTNYQPDDEELEVILCTHNAQVEEINNSMLSKIDGKDYIYTATVTGDFNERNYPTEETLILREGAKVMFTKNDMETPRRFYNGKLGVVDKLSKDYVTVCCGDSTIVVERMQWRNIRYEVNENDQIEEIETGCFSQIPLRLGWAITIHKSQGLTFDGIVIDASRSFAAGQVYVALSRCRSLERIKLLTPIERRNIICDPNINRLQKSFMNEESLQEEYRIALLEYEGEVYANVFRLEPAAALITQACTLASGNKEIFDSETIDMLVGIRNLLKDLATTGTRFAPYLRKYAVMDRDMMDKRLNDAYNFYKPKVDWILEALRQIHDTMPDEYGMDDILIKYNGYITGLEERIELTNIMLDQVVMERKPEQYATAELAFRRRKAAHEVSKSHMHRGDDNNSSAGKHPQLYNALKRMRIELANGNGIPPYSVMSNALMLSISNKQPTNRKELMSISGMGPKRMEKYGEKILACIKQYAGKDTIF